MVPYKFQLGIELNAEGVGILAEEFGLFMLRAMDQETVTAADGRLSSGNLVAGRLDGYLGAEPGEVVIAVA
jgi:hypothetical protein